MIDGSSKSMMDTCRACRTQRKNLRSISQCIGDLSYIEMINTIANVKVGANDGYSDKICLSCCRRTQDAFEFKKMIEESHLKLLYDRASNHAKKIHFDTIDDINCIVEDLQIKYEHTNPEWNIKFESNSNIFNYCNTTIKKCSTTINERYSYVEQLSVEDFLTSIKDENFTDGDATLDGSDNNNDDNYVPPNSAVASLEESGKSFVFERAKPKGKKKIKKKRRDEKANIVEKIVPIFLEDVRLVPTKPTETKPRRPRKNKKAYEKKICPYCGKFSKNLTSHLLLHTGEKSFKCSQCPKAFFTSKLLEYHQEIHSEVRQYKCDHCIAAFYHKSQLRSHVLTHADSRTHTCDICNKGFKRKSALSRHVIRHSSANKTQKCELCNMSFFDKFQLQHHMRVHTGERPYNCEICSQPYSYKHDFNRHCFKKHGVFLKRRSVRVMNHEVLAKERALMKEVVLRARGVLTDGKPVNPFKGPQAAQAYQQALQALQNRQITIDV